MANDSLQKKERFQTTISYALENTQSYKFSKNCFFYLVEIISL